MRATIIATLMLFAGCHTLRSDDKPMSAGDTCRNCCQQSEDACKLDSDHPGYYCPKAKEECITACNANNENEMCVVQTNKQFAASAPKQMGPASSDATASGSANGATANGAAANGASANGSAPPVAAVHPAASAARGECDNRGTWNLRIGDSQGHAVGCAGLGDVPRDVSFRIERQRDQYALRDLVPAPGWQDGFAVQNHDDVCVVTLTRDNKSDADRPRVMTVQLSEKDGTVQGTFHYRENLRQPVGCQLDALVTGVVEAEAPRAAPPQSLPSLPPQQPTQPTVSTPHISGQPSTPNTPASGHR